MRALGLKGVQQASRSNNREISHSEIEEPTLKKIDDVTPSSPETIQSKSQKASPVPAKLGGPSAHNKFIIDNFLDLKEGMLSKEGVDAFHRILSSRNLLPQVVVSTRDLYSLIEKANAFTQPYLLTELGKLQSPWSTHPRLLVKNSYVAPSSETERTLADLWQQVLGIDQVGIHDNFFELGGDSLRAMFLGRLDHQVKLRGFRIELGEIEAALGEHPAVRQAVVSAREDTPGNTRLVAYIVLTQKPAPTTSELRSFLQAKLPEYMVPPAFVLLDSLPLTPNGKVDRHALPAPDQAQSELAGTFVAPHTLLELLLAESWQDVLGVDRVSIYDNFFDLGGHSLLSMQVIARVEKQLGLRIHPRDFIFQTLGQLASACEERMHLLQPLKTRSYTQKVFHMIKNVIFQRTGDRK
jgi:acyl carrier protein